MPRQSPIHLIEVEGENASVYKRPRVIARAAALAHWQLFWFSMLSVLFGAGSLYRMLNANPGLGAGVSELPYWWLAVQSGVWLASGLLGIFCAFWLPGAEAVCRGIQGVLMLLWAGGYCYGWLFQDYAFGWYATLLFVFLAGVIFSPPAWHVTIRRSPE